jgi:hypothetical protein
MQQWGAIMARPLCHTRPAFRRLSRTPAFESFHDTNIGELTQSWTSDALS